MLVELVRTGWVFAAEVVCLGLPIVWFTREWPPLYRLCTGIAGALVLMYLWAFSIYLTHVPPEWNYGLGCGAVAFAVARWRTNVEFFSVGQVQEALGLWLLLAIWSLGLQSLVISYSGGAWAGDLWEHYDRARFFLQHWPHNYLFLGGYWLPARPPLANLVTAAVLAQTDTTFAQYQIITTLTSTLPFLPAIIWLRTFAGKSHYSALLLLLFMASPLFAVNVTFPATKLLTAFFVLTGMVLLHRDTFILEDPNTRIAGWLAFAAGLLAHYSAGPWIVAVGLAIAAVRYQSLGQRAYWRGHFAGAGLCALLCITWFGWSYHVYGWEGTFATNSTVEDATGKSAAGELTMVANNIRDTIIPHFWRSFDKSNITQKNAIGALRDFFFYLYQVNLFFFFGSVGGVLIGYLLLQGARRSARSSRLFWFVVIFVGIILGIAVNSEPDPWGVAHICLKPLAILGLTFLAAQTPTLPPVLRGLFTAGVLVDFALGVVLQFGLESLALHRWIEPGRTVAYYTSTLGLGGRLNFAGKQCLHVLFLGDYFASVQIYIFYLLAATLLIASLIYAIDIRRGIFPDNRADTHENA